MEPLSGNASDKKSLLQSIQAVRANLVTDDIIYHMADSAFYTNHNISTLGQYCFWISHVPETIKEAKILCKQDVNWTPSNDTRYTYFAHASSYGNIDQTWIMFHSIEQQKNREEKFAEKVKSHHKKDRTSLKKMHVKGFACEADARTITQRWLEKHPRYVIQDLVITKGKQKILPKRGRPSPDEPVEIVYKVSCKLEINSEFVASEKELLGRFILASNDTHINPEVILEYYKEQVTVERGFRFIKDQSFHVSEVYLKNESRIAALSMLMVLCLLVYSVAEWQFRQILKEQNAFVRNQKNRPTNKPTMKRVFFFFRRVRQIHEIIDGKTVCTLLNFGVESQDIVNLLGAPFNKYYN
jgi:transposase